MLLKRVATSLSLHLVPHLSLLDQAGFKTTENIIFTPFTTLTSLVPGIPLYDLEDLVEECTILSAPAGSAADELLRQEKRKGKGRWEGFGVGGLDEIFQGWEGWGVVEICGQRRVGKSLLALHAALRALAADHQAQAYWLDTEGSFAPDRARAVLSSWDVEALGIISILERLTVVPCFRAEPDFFDAIQRIRSGLEEVLERDTAEIDIGGSSGGSGKSTRILVVDQLSTLFKDQLINTSSQGHAAMISLLEDISELTYSHHLLTMITSIPASCVPTNPQSVFSSTTLKPGLGASFFYFADITLLVQETGRLFGMVDEDERDRVRSAPGLRAVVEILKSRVGPAGKWAVFETDGTRLFDVIAPPLEDLRTLRLSAGLPVGAERPKMGPLAQTMIP